MADQRESIEANPAAFCALELALLDALARQDRVPVEWLLGCLDLSGAFRYTAVIGDSGRWAFAMLVQRYLSRGICDFKFSCRVTWSGADTNFAPLRRRGAHVRVRVDANNLWSDADRCIEHLRRLDYRFTAIEEPLA